MPCSSVFAFSRPCTPVQGGIRAIYVANPDDVAVRIDSTTGIATLSASKPAVPKPFYRWDVAEGANSLESAPQVNEANNSAYYQHTLTAVLPGFDVTIAGANTLARLQRAIIVVEYMDGTRDLLSVFNGQALNQGASVSLALASGAARGDRRGATVTATLNSLFLPFRVNNMSNLINS